MQVLLAELDYDFSGFTMEGLICWLEDRRGRKILFVPWSMPPTLFGAWLVGEDCDYVFYESDTLPIHQAHIQLHEIAHILCGHPTLKIGSQQAQILLRHARPNPVGYESLPLRSTHSDEAEHEAETLTALIQEKVLRHARLQELTTVVSTDEDIAAYIRAMELV